MHMDYRFCFILPFVCFITQHSLFFISFLAFFSQPVVDKATGRIRERKGGGVLHDGRPCWCLSSSNREWWWRPPWEIDLVSRDTVFRHHHKVILFYHEPSLLSLSLSLSLVLLCSIQGQHYHYQQQQLLKTLLCVLSTVERATHIWWWWTASIHFCFCFFREKRRRREPDIM